MNFSAAHRGVLRWPVAAALLVAAAAHVPVIPEHLTEAPYMGVAFIAFTAVAVVLAVVVAAGDHSLSHSAAIVLCAAAVLMYAATRLVAFPQLGDDVGNWGERLGVVSVISELTVVVLSMVAVRRRYGAAVMVGA
jgi:hypothetical protein